MDQRPLSANNGQPALYLINFISPGQPTRQRVACGLCPRFKSKITLLGASAADALMQFGSSGAILIPPQRDPNIARSPSWEVNDLISNLIREL
jgi:hypothetical protein